MFRKEGNEIRINAFTLIELLIVIVIIGILATLAVPQYNQMMDRTKFSKGWVDLNYIVKSEVQYYFENNHYTNDLRDLDASIPKFPDDYATAMFSYQPNIGAWQVPADHNSDIWIQGINNKTLGAPDGRIAMVHFNDGHLERYINYPWDPRHENWKKVE